MENKFKKISVLTAILFCLFVSIFDADAQTSRRRKKRTNPLPVVSTTVPPSSPAVVSRNNQYLDGNQIILGENPQQSATTETTPTDAPAAPIDDSAEMKTRIKELNSRIRKLESNKESEYDQKQKRLALNLDILTKAESRADSLRKQLFEMIEKENTIKSRLDQIDIDSRSETIDRTVAMMGSLRPEEIRDQRKKSLEAERENLSLLLTQIETNRATLEANVEKADTLVEKIRVKLDKDIDDALATDDENK